MNTWKILIVDDDADTITTARFALADLEVLGKPLDIFQASSAAEARLKLAEHEFAVALFDVVMETNHAGLALVNFLRTDQNNLLTRVILRTGQPGHAPEASVIQDYLIDDYILKSSQDKTRLLTSVTTAIRAYHQLDRHRRFGDGVKMALAGSVSMTCAHSIRALAAEASGQIAILNPSWAVRAAVYDQKTDDKGYWPVTRFPMQFSDIGTVKLPPWKEEDSGVQMDSVGEDGLMIRVHIAVGHNLAFYLHWVNPNEQPDDVDRAVMQLLLNAVRQSGMEVLRRTARIQEVLQAVGVLAHEFRTPLTTMALGLKTLDSRIVDIEMPAAKKDEARNRLTQMQRLVRDMHQKIDQALSNTRLLTASDVRIALRALDLSKVAKETLSKLFPEVEGRSAKLQFRASEECWILMEQESLQQIIGNLVSNAFHAIAATGRRDGEVTVAVEKVPEGDRVRLTCKDNGIGIQEEERKLIFEPFYSNNGSPTHGLGLAVVKRAVAASHGEIELTSKPGEGSSFSITWKRVDAF